MVLGPARLIEDMTEFDKEKLAADVEALGGFNRDMIEQFRANGGNVDSLPAGSLLLLHTTGAKSGEPRLNPLAYLTIDGRMIVVGSYLGAHRDPAWVHNLRATPRARVEVGTEEFDVVAAEVAPTERDELFGRMAELAPVIDEYQAQTDRVIPLFELRRA